MQSFRTARKKFNAPSPPGEKYNNTIKFLMVATVEPRKKYDQVKEVLAKGQGLAAIPGELRQWLINQRRAYDYGRMPEDRVPMFKELLEFAQRYAKRL